MKIVGNCPRCGAPIYAAVHNLVELALPENHFSCDCRELVKAELRIHSQPSGMPLRAVDVSKDS